MSKRQLQEQILELGLYEKLTDPEVFILEALSYGKSMQEITSEGLNGYYFSEWTLYQYRSSICDKLQMEFGKGSRKFIWLTGRYYKQIRRLAEQTKKEEHAEVLTDS